MVPPKIVHKTEPQLPTAAAHSVMLLSLLPPRPSLRCLGWPPNKLLAPESSSQHLPKVDPRKSPPLYSCHTASTQNWVCSPHFSPERQPEEPPASQPQALKANSSQLNPSVSYSRSGLLPICPEGTFHTFLPPSPLSIKLFHLGEEGKRKGMKEGEHLVSWSVFLSHKSPDVLRGLRMLLSKEPVTLLQVAQRCKGKHSWTLGLPVPLLLASSAAHP